MTENDFGNIEYCGAQRALKDKMESKLFEAKRLVEKAHHEDFALVMEVTTSAMNLLLEIQELYRRVCGNKAKRASPMNQDKEDVSARRGEPKEQGEG